MLSITQSHHLDHLFNALSQFLGDKTTNPFQPLTVLVPSLAVGRWLTYQWASHFGISANLNTEFPANFMWQTFGSIVPETPKSALLSAEAMQWRVFEALATLPQEDMYQVLQRYLERAPQPLLGRWQLAGRIAEVFSHYRTYRRDWLASWRDGQLLAQDFRHQDWQAALWRQLFAEEHHQQGHLLTQFARQLQREPSLRARLPERLAVFTTVRLPPNELDFFRVLSQFIDVQFYHCNPCGQYWADIVDERWLAKMKARQSQRVNLYEKGHPLLTAWGKQARDTFRLLVELSGGEQENDWQDDFPEIAQPHLLAQLQHSLHTLEHQDEADWTLRPDDQSIQIHNCHSLTRQLEVLHDTLLGLMAADATLKPQDIVVMVPDIASASGAIEAVFGTMAEGRRIPWQLTGVASPEENSLWRAFVGLYELSQSRLSRSAFIDWLSLVPVATYYGLAAEDIEQCGQLLERAAVYRCLDGQHRAQMTDDASDTDDVHSFLFGLERLLLSTVLPDEANLLYAGIQPVTGIDVGDFHLIGVLTQAVSDLAERRDWLHKRQSARTALALLQADVQRFFIAQVGQRAWDTLNKALTALGETLSVSPASETIPLSLLLHNLEQRITASAPGAVPGGSVHFSRLGALRLLPYRVICILGLEDTAFPRRELPNEFDLLAQDTHPRPGDRSRRDDDKGMFLEALMAASDHLLLFYNGASNSQAAKFPPSSLISQLLDYLGRRVIEGKDAVEKQLIRQHWLQPFSPNYYRQTPNQKPHQSQSYAEEWLAAAQAVSALAGQRQPEFVDAQVPLDETNRERGLSVDELHRFYQHPAKFFVSRQLKLYIDELSDQDGDEEPLRLNNLAKWHLRSELLSQAQVSLPRLRASGQLPVGEIGKAYCQQTEQALQPLKSALAQCRHTAERQRQTITIGQTQLLCSLPSVAEPYQLDYVVSKGSAKHVVKAWLTHLAWQAQGAYKATYWLFLDRPWRFQPLVPELAQQYLTQWLQGYDDGLQQPLVLEQESAWAYVQQLKNPKTTDDEAIRKAREKWQEKSADIYWRQVLTERQREFLAPDFIERTQTLYAPILAHGHTLKWPDLKELVS